MTQTITKLKTPLERLRAHIEQANNAWLKLEFQRQDLPANPASKEEIAEWEHQQRLSVRSAIQEVTVDPDFRALIPALTLGEKEQLKQNLLAEGVRDPLVLWETQTGALFLLDGHNRREVILAHGLLFTVDLKQFGSHAEAHDWMINNQLGRRNLSSTQRSYLLGSYYNATKGQRGGDRKNDKTEEPSLSRAEKIAEEQNVSPTSVKRSGKIAEAIERLGNTNPEAKAKVLAGEADITQGQLAELASAACEVIASAAEAIAKGQPLQDEQNAKKPHVTHNSGNDEWYTPKQFTEAARVVMGSIDVDPASSEIANQTVQAKTFYTAETNGLDKPWPGNVWLNPPYSQPLLGQFIDTLLEKLESGEVKQAIVLLNNATETAVHQKIMQRAAKVCFPRGRIKFLDEAGQPVNSPLQGQMIVYLGTRVGLFPFNRIGFDVQFKPLGVVLDV